MKIRDESTGKVLGTAFVIPFRGRIHLIGFHTPNDDWFIVPKFKAQKRLTYWHQSITFTTHPTPDYENEHTEHHSNTPDSVPSSKNDGLVEK